ncbi:hypothetical protein SAMN06269185_2108 [Natronoarchaeum philippinense]|uniref:DUF7312 domain-containing protein n=1 Tax=Natronoarchaeum philippinense TaxID=558529 RepID=A0A285NV07_NATPI|nr:hypothetical protein [Natronoarchaeum philippinense]SNZ13295.1 hypothetical protein SAMN06269185_2108 [Natronoarchaeum philippinense]
MAAPSDDGEPDRDDGEPDRDDGEPDRDDGAADEWKYSLADLENENGEDEDEDAETAERVIDRSIEPEEIDLENAAFVALGAIVAVLIFVRTVTIFTL